MTFVGAGDLQAFMADARSSLTVGAVTATVWRRDVDEALGASGYADEPVEGHVTEILFPTGTFPALAIGVTVTLDGASYEVRDLRQWGDGAFTKCYLAAAGT